jgi:hypothetical protein
VALSAASLSPADWDEVAALAHDLGLGWVLQRALDYAAAYLGLEPPVPPLGDPPPRFGPLRAGELLDGWLGVQVGRLALGGWGERDGYLRSALRARRQRLGSWIRRRSSGPGAMW